MGEPGHPPGRAEPVGDDPVPAAAWRGGVLLVGHGHMGAALLAGWLRNGMPVARFTVVEPVASLRDAAAAAGVRAVADPAMLDPAVGPAAVVLAVKPQILPGLLPAYAGWAGGPTLFLSIAAGIDIATLAAGLPGPTPVLRCMPNTPAAIGQGAMAYCGNDHVTAAGRALARSLLAAGGRLFPLAREADMDAVTALSGSGPAYVFLFAECLARAGVAAGLAPELAAGLARQTVTGAAALMGRQPESPAVLRRQVASPGGTTAAGLRVLAGDDTLAHLLTDAVAAAAARSRQLRDH